MNSKDWLKRRHYRTNKSRHKWKNVDTWKRTALGWFPLFFIALHPKLTPIISAGSVDGRRESSYSFDQVVVLLVKESQVRDF